MGRRARPALSEETKMRLLGVTPPPWLIGLAGLLFVAIGYSRGHVLALGIGVVLVVLAVVRQIIG